LELFIVLIAWFAVHMSTNWVAYIWFCYCHITNAMHPWETAVALQLRVHASRQRKALLAGLIEFQKAQCFFNVTVMIASLLAVSQGKLGIQSGMDWDLNVSFLSYITGVGTTAVAMNQFLLHAAHMRSWYVSLLSTITILLASISVKTMRKHRAISRRLPKTFAVDEYYPPWPMDSIDTTRPCGNNSSPITSCTNHWVMEDLGIWYKITLATVIYSTLVVVCVIVHQICSVAVSFNQNAPRGQPQRLLLALATHGHRLLNWICCVVDDRLTSFAGQCLYFVIGYGFLIFSAGFISQLLKFSSTNDWDLGQIIAVAIWMPSLLQYIYLAIGTFHDLNFNNRLFC
jgi:hypothetical protein